MTQILVAKPGTLTAADRKVLRSAGVIVVQVENPSEVRLIAAEGVSVNSDDLLFAALTGCSYASGAQALFAKELLSIITKSRAEAKAAIA